jgi:hypothetical protein
MTRRSTLEWERDPFGLLSPAHLTGALDTALDSRPMLYTYLLLAMMAWIPPQSAKHASEERAVAHAILQASPDTLDRLLLASLGAFEGSYRIGARGKLGEIGPWQLRPPPVGRAVPRDLEGQAREALYRWKTLGPCGYTGEGAKGPSHGMKGCPMAEHRFNRAVTWWAAHPLNDATVAMESRTGRDPFALFPPAPLTGALE